jgi:hypothetical protein
MSILCYYASIVPCLAWNTPKENKGKLEMCKFIAFDLLLVTQSRWKSKAESASKSNCHHIISSLINYVGRPFPSEQKGQEPEIERFIKTLSMKWICGVEVVIRRITDYLQLSIGFSTQQHSQQYLKACSKPVTRSILHEYRKFLLPPANNSRPS